MNGDADVAAAAALLADPARAALLLAVMERGPTPASELARRAGIARSTASGHLARLAGAGFVSAHRHGRQRRYALADPAVADAVEVLARIAPRRRPRSLRESLSGERVRTARTCYDHLAGRLGVELARGLVQRGVLVLHDGGYAIGPAAEARLAPLGVDLGALSRGRRPVVRACLDWSEREPHVAGALGAAIATRLFELRWIARGQGDRSVAITEAGREPLRTELGVDLRDGEP